MPGRPKDRATDRPSAAGAPFTDHDGAEEAWILDEVRSEAGNAVGRARRPGKAHRAPSRDRTKGSTEKSAQEPVRDLGDEFVNQVGPRRAAKLEDRLRQAGRAFRRERYVEARAELRKLRREAPGSSSVRELLGLTYYRLGQWKDAIRELEAFRTLTGSAEQNPVLADCNRALGHHREVQALWDELREASPGAELVAEGRIVMAGSQADRGDLPSAVATLSAGRWRVKRPREHHVRMAYALADLHERAGDLPKARELFDWVIAHSEGFADASDRRRALG